MANRTFQNFGHFYAPHTMPVLIDCNFVVDSTNGNGFGVRSFKGPGVSKVYMHTSATPAAGSPNPANGVIVVQLQDDYNQYFGGFSGQVSPTGSNTAAITANTAYVITSLGTTTLAQWQTAGVPVGFTPAVGTAFIAAVSETISGSPTVAPTATAGSGIDHIEVLGDPNQTIANTSIANPAVVNSIGSQLILQCFSGGVVTAPANGSVINLSFYLGNSSVMVKGE